MAYLPDLIRKGAENTRPEIGTYLTLDDNCCVERACVTGAVAVGLFGLEDVPTGPNFWSRLGEAIDSSTPTVQKGHASRMPRIRIGGGINLSTALTRLNDKATVSRENIADWLEETFTTGELTIQNLQDKAAGR